MTKTTIEIDENLTVRLSVYRHEKGLSSWMEAISHLLDAAEKSPKSGTVPVISRTETECSPARDIQIVYYGDTGKIGENEFKCLLLERGSAHVRIHYTNGTQTDHFWRANNMRKDSNVRGNIMTSSRVRGWRERGIYKAEFSIPPFARNAT